jgi:hypothetical protein
MAVAADRNMDVQWANINVLHDDANAFSNNPSGALWFETPLRGSITNAHVKLIARDSREASTDSSAIQLFLYNNSKYAINNVTFETATASYTKHAIRGSNNPGAELSISNSSFDCTGSAIQLANLSGLMGNLNISNTQFLNGPVYLYDSADTKIENCLFTNDIFIGCSALNAPTGGLKVSNSKFTGQVTLQGIGGNVFWANNETAGMGVATQGGSQIPRLVITGGTSSGVIFLGSGINGALITGLETERKIEFQNVRQYTVSGCTIKTSVPEACLLANAQISGYTKRAVFANNSLWVQQGVSGAGFTVFGSNNLSGTYLDVNNDKQQFAWV